MTIRLARLAGRCANGYERDRGQVVHAIEGDRWRAICGKAPGRTSAGWAHPDPAITEPTCPACVRALRHLTSQETTR